MTVFATKKHATNATTNESGSAAPDCGAAAGALRITASTGAITAAESATQFGSVRMPFCRRCPPGLAADAAAADDDVDAIREPPVRSSYYVGALRPSEGDAGPAAAGKEWSGFRVQRIRRSQEAK